MLGIPIGITNSAIELKICTISVNIVTNPRYHGYQTGLASMVYKFFDNKSETFATRDKPSSSWAIKNKIMSSKELAEELRKKIVTDFEKRKLHSSFIDNIWGPDLADMQLITKFDKGFRFLWLVFDIYSKLA